ncbi:MAG: serine/threonine protein kinase [Planctomycetia bacterium]|nr:MAG: serine/threonine protein kinase [Planctomycetia bacterium]
MTPGTIINKRYEVLQIVGRGGMGTVVRARRVSDGETVAVKYCHLKDAASIRRFKREIRLMRELKHAHVVPILKLSTQHDPPYFVMPFAEFSCGRRCEEFAADENSAIDAFLELCEGVQAIHAAGMVHRDIKPDNALIVDGRVVVADLGLAKFVDRDTTILTQTQAVVGTELYLAPEQRFSGGSRDADGRTDIYQLGKTLYQFLTNLEPAIMDMSKVPPGLAFAIRKATRENPNERYQTIGQLIDAVKTYQKARDPNANPANAFESLLNRIKERLERGEYREDDVGQMLATLMLPVVRQTTTEFLDMFDRVPHEVLAILPETHPEQLDELLRVYVGAIEEQVTNHSFSYAEIVAKKMRVLFGAAGTTPEVKGLCIEATLIAAVRLNRFAAMDTLNSMLTAVVDEADAMAVREALERQRTEYRGVCEQIPALNLHAAIRSLREELLSQESS